MPSRHEQAELSATLGPYIREQRRVSQLSLRRLAARAGISNPYLSQIERGLRQPSALILRQIARALSVSTESLYVRAGILDERPVPVDVIGEIGRDPTLSVDQRRALVQIYESFRAETAAAPTRTGPESSGPEKR